MATYTKITLHINSDSFNGRLIIDTIDKCYHILAIALTLIELGFLTSLGLDLSE